MAAGARREEWAHWATAAALVRWGTRYPKAALAIQFQAAHFVALAGVALLTIYVSMPDADFLRILVVTQALILLDNLVALKLVYRMLRPVRAWLRGSRTMEEFSTLLGLADLFPVEPIRDSARFYRRWAFESAALDLALRQNGLSLQDAVGRVAKPVTFVVSTTHCMPSDGVESVLSALLSSENLTLDTVPEALT